MAGVSYSSTWVQICNRALGRLGTGRITSLQDASENNQNVSYCNLFLGDAIEDVLGNYDWSCSRKRSTLAMDSEPPEFEYEYQFTLPVDFIRVIEVRANGLVHTVENGHLLTDSETVELIYIARPTDPNSLSPLIRKAITASLAFLLTTPLTSSEALSSRIAAEYASAFEAAKTADAQSACDVLEEGQPWYDEARR